MRVYTAEKSIELTDATKWLESVFDGAPADQFVERRTIDPRTRRAAQSWWPLTELKGLVDPALDGLVNVYVGICPRVRKGGTASDITHAGCLWIDDPKNPLPDDFPKPTVVVETSPEKHQLIWKLDEWTDELDRVESLNGRLRDLVGGDHVQDRARILRLPGFRNVKPEHPEQPRARLTECDARRTVSLDEIEAALDVVHEQYVADYPTPEGKSQITEGRRNSTLTSLADRLWRTGLDESAIAAALLEHNEQHCSPPLPSGEVQQIARSVARYVQGSVEWADPMPFPEIEGPAFPLDVLPHGLKKIVAAHATALQVPVGMAATLAIAAISAAANGRAIVAPMPGWREQLGLFVTVVLPSGDRKSPSLSFHLRPLEDHERALQASYAGEASEKKVLVAIAEEQLKRAKKEAAKDADSTAMATARDLQRQLDSLDDDLAGPRLLADDTTPEALAGLLAGNRALTIASSEGGIFSTIAGRYSRGVPNLDVFLKGYTGDTLRIDRRSRPPEFVRHPSLSILLTVQPDVLFELSGNPTFRGRGLLARFLYEVPRSKVGFREMKPTPMPQSLSRHWASCLGAILDMPLPEPGEEPVITISPEADDAFTEFRSEIEVALRPGGSLHDIRDWGGQTPRSGGPHRDCIPPVGHRSRLEGQQPLSRVNPHNG